MGLSYIGNNCLFIECVNGNILEPVPPQRIIVFNQSNPSLCMTFSCFWPFSIFDIPFIVIFNPNERLNLSIIYIF